MSDVDTTIEKIEALPDGLKIPHPWLVEDICTASELKTLTARVRDLEAALRHYADPENWICQFDSCLGNPCPHGESFYLHDKDEKNAYDIASAALGDKEGR